MDVELKIICVLKKIRNKIFYLLKDIAWTHVMDKKILLFLTGFNDFKHGNGEPKICDICFSDEFEEKPIDHINSIVCESELKCKRCGEVHGYFAYGHWEY